MKHQTLFCLMTTVAAVFMPGGGDDNLLENPSFETGDLTGWTEVAGFVVGAPVAGPQSGSFACEITLGGGVGELVQTFPASAGEEYYFSGWMLAESGVPAGTFGLYKILFRDAGGNDLLVTDITTGGQDPNFPGVESTPFLNELSASGVWVFSEAQGVAPAGTVEVLFLVLNVDFGGGTNPIWYDNAQASIVGDGTNLLFNGGFETGDISGWSDIASGGGASVGAPGVGAEDGSFAAVLAMDSATTTIRQVLPASPGDEFNFSGYLLTEGFLPPGDTFGLFKIVFQDAGGNDLEPASVSIGNPTPNPDVPGINSTPLLNNASPLVEWIFSQAQGVAPEGTVQVLFLVLNVDFAPPGGIPEEMWYDNISATLVNGGCDFDLGDVNQDGMVTLLDVDPFVQVLTKTGFQCEADVNEDGVVSLLDVDPFVQLLSGG